MVLETHSSYSPSFAYNLVLKMSILTPLLLNHPNPNFLSPTNPHHPIIIITLPNVHNPPPTETPIRQSQLHQAFHLRLAPTQLPHLYVAPHPPPALPRLQDPGLHGLRSEVAQEQEEVSSEVSGDSVGVAPRKAHGSDV
jgi:hypothetical protein